MVTIRIQSMSSMALLAPLVMVPVVARAVGVLTMYIGLFVAMVYAGALEASLAAGEAMAHFSAILVNQAGLMLCAPSGALPTSPMSFPIF